MGYASGTTVSPEKTRGEIESMVKRFGCTAYQSGYDSRSSWIMFVHKERLVRFALPFPDPKDPKFRPHLCNRCAMHDGGNCKIKLDSLAFDESHPEHPQEWRYDSNGKPTCTAFRRPAA